MRLRVVVVHCVWWWWTVCNGRVHRYAPVVVGSAKTGDGIDEAMDLVAEAARWRSVKVPRKRLNELFQRAQVCRRDGAHTPHTAVLHARGARVMRAMTHHRTQENQNH